MKEFFLYLLQVSLIQAAFFLFYLLFLRSLTFFRMNRICLLAGLIVAFLLPLMDISLPLTIHSYSYLIPDLSFPDGGQEGGLDSMGKDSGRFSLWFLLCIIYSVGCLYFLLRMVFFLRSVARILRNASVVRSGSLLLVKSGDVSFPFSFFCWYFTGEQFVSPVVQKHEEAHIRQFHSFDLLVMEVVLIVLWFNPFVFFHKKAIRANHEFLADNSVIHSGVPPIEYLLLLGTHRISTGASGLASPFNQSLIQKRMKKIIATPSKKYFLFLYLLILPLSGLFFILFSFSPGENDLVSSKYAEGTKGGYHETQVREKNFLFPLDTREYKLTAGFGIEFLNPITQKKVIHRGVDYKAKEGTSVLSASSGVVAKVAEEKGYGKMIILNHTQGIQTLYAHLSRILVKEGENMEGGKTIGEVGNTGYSTAPHLHFEILEDGKPVNPEKFLP